MKKQYVASTVKTTRKFHRRSCKFGRHVLKSTYGYDEFDCREKAIAAGYRPCRVCNP